jgi:hypothetical protein
VLAPIFKWMITKSNVFTIFNTLAVNKRIYWLMVVPVVLFAAMVRHFPQTHNLVNDWCWLIYWLLFFIAGFLCISYPQLLNSLAANRRFSLTIAVVSFAFINFLRWNDLEPGINGSGLLHSIGYYSYPAIFAITAWCWVFAIIGYGKQYLNRKHAALEYTNAAAYPFYILHQTVIVVFAFYVVKTSDDILSKYIFIVVGTFMVTVMLYHLFIKPFRGTRFLFGVKQATPVKSKTRQMSPVPESLLQQAAKVTQ